MKAGPGNRKGFFEDLDIMKVNISILRRVNATAFDPQECDASVIRQLATGSFGSETARLVTAKLGDSGPFAAKDPRFCILADFWRYIVQQVDCKVSAVLVIRDPLSAAASLYQRDGLSRNLSLTLWKRYTTGAIFGIDQSWPCVIVDSDNMLRSPGKEIERIARWLGLTVSESDLVHFIDAFLDQRLWHSRERVSRAAYDSCGTEVFRLYDILRECAGYNGLADLKGAKELLNHA